MSKKILRPLLTIAAVGLTIFGGPLGLGTIAGLGLKIGVGALAGLSLGVASAVLLRPKVPRVSPNATDRLTASLDPNAPRKIALGHTALATDVRYQGYTGTNQDYVEWIVAVASHTVEAISEIWFDSTKAWSASGGVTSDYTGYLTVAVRNPGTSSNGIAIDSTWTTSCTLTGCAYLHIKFKVTGNSKKAESPFSSSIPSRVTVRGKGAFLPDIREDGVDATDQSTWDWFDDDSGRNPALQLLFYLLGWKINGKLAVGRGIPADRLDLDSFITAANLCDEPVTKAAGGTEPRYRCDALFSEGDDPDLVIGGLCDAMNAILRDTGGKIGLYVLHNDLATPVCAFTEADIIGDDQWQQTPGIDQTTNIVRGRYVDASDAGLYQLVDYPEVDLESVDGIDRIDNFDLPCVQSASQAQRLAKQRLQRNQYRGVFQAKFNYRAWQVNLGDVVTLSHSALGWEDKLFRVAGTSVGLNGVVDLILKEENEAIYAWDAEEAAPVTPATPTIYDPTKSAFNQAIDEIELTPGPGGLACFLTNEAHTVPASSAGVVSSYAGAEGDFKVFVGADDVSADFALSTQANPQSLAVTYTDQHYEVTGGLDSGEDSALLTIRATGSGDYDGITIDRDFSLAKSKAGATGATGAAGADAKLLYVYSDRQLITLDADGSANPATQTTTFTATKQNTTGTVAWTIADTKGNALTAATYLSATSGDSVTMTAANFLAACAVNGASGVIVTGTIAADSLSDKITVVKAQKGATGADGADGTPGPATYTLVQSASNRLDLSVPGVVSKPAGTTAFDNSCRTVAPYQSGVRVEWTIDSASIATHAIGLDPSATLSESTAHDGWDYAFIVNNTGTIQRRVNGSSTSLTGTAALGSKLAIDYDGKRVVATMDGTVVDTYDAIADDALFYVFAEISNPGRKIVDLGISSGGRSGDDGISPVLVTVDPPSFTIACNADGSPKSGVLPQDFVFTAMQGGAVVAIDDLDVDASPGCTTSTSGNVVTMTAISATSGSINATVTVGDQEVEVAVPFTTTNSGGAGGSTSASLQSTDNIASGTYAQLGGELTLNASAAGKLSLNLTGAYKVTPNSSLLDLTAQTKIQMKPAAGSYSDVSGTEKTGTAATTTDSSGGGTGPFIARPGGVNGTGPYVVTGLSAGASYVMRIMGRKASGSASATSQCTLTLTAEQVS